jgi:hypothetical protein
MLVEVVSCAKCSLAFVAGMAWLVGRQAVLSADRLVALEVVNPAE